MEAMACGKPTIGTLTGNGAFMNAGNSFLIPGQLVPVSEELAAEIPIYAGQRVVAADSDALTDILRLVASNSAEVTARAAAGQQDILEKFNYAEVGKQLLSALDLQASVPATATPVLRIETAERTKPKVRIRFEGAVFSWHSLACVNREILKHLATRPEVELSILPIEPEQFGPEADPALAALKRLEYAPLSGPADFHIRHFYPPRFTRPEEGRLILIQPWEYYSLPVDWVQPVKNTVDEVWCYSQAVRQCYTSSGISDSQLAVVPLGADTSLFRSNRPPYVFNNEPGAARIREMQNPFVFLFVGGTIERKGISTLLDAYTRAFSAFDNVLLIIKDTGTKTVYRGGTIGDEIRALAQDPTRPAIIYIDEELIPAELASLYACANVVVLPYHNEGFCLPAIEAMAAGVPPMVPAGGPTDDFCDDEVAYRVTANLEKTGTNRVGDIDCVGETSRLVITPRDLGAAMRAAYSNPQEAARRGANAAQRVRQNHTWQHTADAIWGRLQSLLAQKPASAPGKAVAKAVRPAAGKAASVKDRRSSGGHPAQLRPAPKIALCMIMKDEERVLAECLSSVRPYVDAIYIADTGSTDRSVEIAESFGAIVSRIQWPFSFSAARNHSLDMVQDEDYILWIDCDDTMPPHCGEAMRRLVATAEDNVTGYLMQVHIPPGPGADGYIVVDHLKLCRSFKDERAIRFSGRIHEQLLDSVYKAGGTVERTDIYVVHSGYDHSPEGQARKREREDLLLRLDEEEQPNHPFPKWNLGMTFYYRGDYPAAIEKLEACLALAGPRDSTNRKAYALLCAAYSQLKQPDKAREYVERGLNQYPTDPELLFRAANLYQELGDLARAEQTYKTLFSSAQSGHIDSVDVTTSTYKARHNLALVYLLQNRVQDAERELLIALQYKQDFAPSIRTLGEVYLQQNRLSDAQSALAHLESLGSDLAQALRADIQKHLGMHGR
jgi:glycosyltransferase involved in cell wall biosynthesis